MDKLTIAVMVTSYQGLLAALACNNVKCKIRSFLLSRSTRSFLKVDLRNDTPSGVSVTGASNDASLTTVFRLEHCLWPSGCTIGNCKLVTKVYWDHNQTYLLATNSNQVTMEAYDQTSNPERYLFSLKTVRAGCTNPCKAFKTLFPPRRTYVTNNNQGTVAVSRRTRRHRDTWFWLESCYK
ncbi:PREDICTED: uncharacterized protein LOC107347726 [Acropora digitifera]|uniref:uncharacterized protein LOC107347726 n=1 Tax=Acropora digitifera TaxID=70779 RepID=UPI00077A9FEA|nr:PREDICTED: uncharacterized protein LOC107347726 [Acropora digitifera]